MILPLEHFIHSSPTIRQKRVQTIIREIVSNNTYQSNHFKNSYKLLPEKLLEIIFANYCPITISNHPYKLLIRKRVAFFEIFISGRYHRDMEALKILASNSKHFRIYGIFKKWQIGVPRLTF